MADLPLSDINSDSDRMLPVSPCEGVETAMHELLPGGLLYCDARSMGMWSAGHPGHFCTFSARREEPVLT